LLRPFFIGMGGSFEEGGGKEGEIEKCEERGICLADLIIITKSLTLWLPS
jgi:hypothetical protein